MLVLYVQHLLQTALKWSMLWQKKLSLILRSASCCLLFHCHLPEKQLHTRNHSYYFNYHASPSGPVDPSFEASTSQVSATLARLMEYSFISSRYFSISLLDRST